MSVIRQLVLPDTYEELAGKLQNDYAKMSQFVVPVEEAEKRLAVIAQSLGSAGKIVLLLGVPGIGKSTFIQSLTWRKHLPISEITEIDANQFFGKSDNPLNLLYQNIQNQAAILVSTKRPGTVPTIVINYLEHLADLREDDIRAFFRNVNGLLRRHAILIIWPMTEDREATRLLQYASAVSGTVFSDEPTLRFRGPHPEEFPRIAKDTISTLNPGLSFDDFLLNDDELSVLLTQLRQENESKQTVRDYLRAVKQEWYKKSGHLRTILDLVPKPTEIWFVVCYTEAEAVVSQFARKSPYSPDDTWDADYRRLSEYIVDNTQKAADWDPKRLQYALRGAFRTKIMFMPTNAILCCIAAYGLHNSVSPDLVDRLRKATNINWSKPVIARRFLSSSPMIRQLNGDAARLGLRKTGIASTSIGKYQALFEEVNKHILNVSDQPFNRCLAQALREIFEVDEDTISSERDHPFLSGIRPDILIKLDPEKLVCIEMFYTINTLPSNLADYVLGKLNRYMKQFDYYSQRPQLFYYDDPHRPDRR